MKKLFLSLLTMGTAVLCSAQFQTALNSPNNSYHPTGNVGFRQSSPASIIDARIDVQTDQFGIRLTYPTPPANSFLANRELLRIGPNDFFVSLDGVGIKNSSPLSTLQLGSKFHFIVYNDNNTITNNAYFDGATYKRTTNDQATQFSMTGDGDIYIRTAEQGSAGTDITWINGIRVRNDGKVGVGTITDTDMDNASGYQLYVENGIITEKVKVALKGTGDWSDFVFDKDYRLLPLSEVSEYINQNGHLPDVPSAEEVVKTGINLAEMDAKLLQKIEELTLYMIELKKENEELRSLIKK